MTPITKAQYSKILFNPTIRVSEVRTRKRSSLTGKVVVTANLVSGGRVIAGRVIADTTTYWEAS